MLAFLKSVFGGAKREKITALRLAGAVVIDVRTPGEFAGGHTKGAINIPLDELNSKVDTIRLYKKPIILCCASGTRSGRAKAILNSKGLPDLHNAGSWKNV